jgi:hypothetical protein
MRMFPVSFSLKKIRPSGANVSETGKLRLVRTGVTNEAAWTEGNIAEADSRKIPDSKQAARARRLREVAVTKGLLINFKIPN